MSDYHILLQNINKEFTDVVFHFPVNVVATNQAGVLYTAIVKKVENLTSEIPGFQIDFPTEYTDMQNGKVIERKITVQFSSADLTPAQKLAEIKNGNYIWEGYTARKTRITNESLTKWEWYGANGNV